MDRRSPRTTRPTAAIRSRSRILHECHLAVSLVEVTQRSLESLDIAYPEQEVLKRVLKVIWSVHDWIDGLRVDDEPVGQGDEP